MAKKWFFVLMPLLLSCHSETKMHSSPEKAESAKKLSQVEKYYQQHANDSIVSEAMGSVGNGQLKNATLIPFEGSNYTYFDQTSYLGGRAFTHSKVAEITLATYTSLENQNVKRKFRVMEFSRKDGGKIFPHRTHQNGLSVDFMMPLQKDGVPFYELDDMGASHYLLEFDKNGNYLEDPTVSIDFDMAARHLLELDIQARKKGMRIHKVIFNTHLKDELYASKYGKKLQQKGIYVTRNLTKTINDLHDDHYHVDFIAL